MLKRGCVCTSLKAAETVPLHPSLHIEESEEASLRLPDPGSYYCMYSVDHGLFLSIFHSSEEETMLEYLNRGISIHTLSCYWCDGVKTTNKSVCTLASLVVPNQGQIFSGQPYSVLKRMC